MRVIRKGHIKNLLKSIFLSKIVLNLKIKPDILIFKYLIKKIN